MMGVCDVQTIDCVAPFFDQLVEMLVDHLGGLGARGHRNGTAVVGLAEQSGEHPLDRPEHLAQRSDLLGGGLDRRIGRVMARTHRALLARTYRAGHRAEQVGGQFAPLAGRDVIIFHITVALARSVRSMLNHL